MEIPGLTVEQALVVPQYYEGEIIIEWPPATSYPALTVVREAVTGEMIYSVVKMVVHVSCEQLMWAEVIMFADQNGYPIYRGKPVMQGNGEPLLGCFGFQVREVRMRDDG